MPFCEGLEVLSSLEDDLRGALSAWDPKLGARFETNHFRTSHNAD